MRSREGEEGEVNLNNMLQQQNDQPSSVPSWSSTFRNPRIVRASRAFGGKDRHSKVCTVRGLRDRRIRLSVPTAIQLYDLQDRLGLSQPSKVIDWLLEAAKDDVDELPSLQFPHGFNQLYPSLIFGDSSSTSAFPGFLQNWDLGGSSSRITDTTTTHRESFGLDKGKWIKDNENSNHQEHGFDMNHQHFSLANPYNNNTSSHYNLGHLQHSLDQSGNSVTVATSNVPNNNNNNLNLNPPLEMSSLLPTYHSFLGDSNHHHHHHAVDRAGNLQHFSSNANTGGNLSLIRPFPHLISSNHDMDRHSSDNDSGS